MSATHLGCNDFEKEELKIMVITGASGGHIFPALGFLETLKDKHNHIDTLLILPKKSIKNRIGNVDCKVNYISIAPIKLSFNLKNLLAILKFFKGAMESIFILLAFKPDVVVGFGSLVSIPMLLFSWTFRIKTLIHEQNVTPGRATRFLAVFTDRIAISFAQTQDYFKNLKRKIVLTGNPIRKELRICDKQKALDFLKLSPDKLTILVMGGSQGSHRINVEFLKAVSAISNKSALQVIHLVGAQDYNLLERDYKDLNVKIRLFDFLKEMKYAYNVCDLVVSRAGATTLTEIIFFRLPAIIIPYPFAYKHQMENARILERVGSAVIINDEELETGILRKIISDLINNPERIETMRSCYSNISLPNANDLLVNEVLSLN